MGSIVVGDGMVILFCSFLSLERGKIEIKSNSFNADGFVGVENVT